MAWRGNWIDIDVITIVRVDFVHYLRYSWIFEEISILFTQMTMNYEDVLFLWSNEIINWFIFFNGFAFNRLFFIIINDFNFFITMRFNYFEWFTLLFIFILNRFNFFEWFTLFFIFVLNRFDFFELLTLFFITMNWFYLFDWLRF